MTSVGGAVPATRLQFSVSVSPDGAFVPIGELDLSTIQELRNLVAQVMRPGRPIVLDLAQLTFMDSNVIHWLVEVYDATGRRVILRNASPVVRRILDTATAVDSDGDAWAFEADRAERTH